MLRKRLLKPKTSMRLASSVRIKHPRTTSPTLLKSRHCLSSAPLRQDYGDPVHIPSATTYPQPHSYPNLLQACLRQCKRLRTHHLFDEMSQRVVSRALLAGKVIHGCGIKLGYSSKGLLGNLVLDLYVKCGSVDSAIGAFDHLEGRDIVAWNSILSMGLRTGSLREVEETFRLVKRAGLASNEYTFAIVSSACARLEDLEFGRQVQCDLVKLGFEDVSFCQGALIDMYAKCGCLEDARVVFDGAEDPDTVSWTALIAGYVKFHRPDEAVSIFEKMEKSGHSPDQVALVTIVSAYVSLGKMDLSYKLFHQMSNPSVIAWNVMISGHAQKGLEAEALEFFQRMRESGGKSTRSTFGSVFSAIAGLGRNDYGSIVHSEAIKRGLSDNVYVGSSLINMYAKCKEMGSATKVFVAIDEKNVVLWNAMLGGFAQNGHASEVLRFYWEMKGCGFQPDEYTYTSIFSACACLQYLELGRQLHGVVLKNMLASHLFVGNALVDMYAKCGIINDSKKQFECQKIRDKVSWNAIIVGYVQEEEEYEAFEMFRRMSSTGIVPDEVALASILSACANIQSLKKGEQCHCLGVKCGLETSLYAGSALIDMYAKCGVVDAARRIFLCMPERSVASMNSMMSGCAKSDLQEAISIFEEMRAIEMSPSQITFACLLDACNGVEKLDIGKQVHCFILKRGVSYHEDFLGISLMGMYTNARFLTDANMVFQEFPCPKSNILWTALISGYVHNDCNEEALHYFREMRSYDTPPDQATFASILKACAALCSLRDGRQIHCVVFLYGFDLDELTACTLIDMYAKCGEIGCSVQVFNGIDDKTDIIIWNSMIVGLAQNGFAKNALEVFDSMKQSGVVPDEVTFLGILTACSHAGLVSQGRFIYEEMVKCYSILPRADHNACMVDLLGRWGSLGEAVDFINDLSCKPDSMIWMSLLGACRLHGDEVKGKLAAEKLMELEPRNPTPYILLSNIYAATGNWHEVNLLRRKMKDNEVKKSPGYSWISVGQEISYFVAGDDSHPSAGEIRDVLNELTIITKKEYDIDMEYFLCGG